MRWVDFFVVGGGGNRGGGVGGDCFFDGNMVDSYP